MLHGPGHAGDERLDLANLGSDAAGLKVLFMSGYMERPVAAEPAATFTWLQKPVSPDDLAAKVRGALGPPHPLDRPVAGVQPCPTATEV